MLRRKLVLAEFDLCVFDERWLHSVYLMNVIESSVGFQVNLEKYLLILTIRSRIEELEWMFLPPILQNLNRKEKWNRIMFVKSTSLRFNEEMKSLRRIIPPHSRKDLVLMATILYGDFSDIAAHRVKYPTTYKEESVVEMLNSVNIKPDGTKVSKITTLLKPL